MLKDIHIDTSRKKDSPSSFPSKTASVRATSPTNLNTNGNIGIDLDRNMDLDNPSLLVNYHINTNTSTSTHGDSNIHNSINIINRADSTCSEAENIAPCSASMPGQVVPKTTLKPKAFSSSSSFRPSSTAVTRTLFSSPNKDANAVENGINGNSSSNSNILFPTITSSETNSATATPARDNSGFYGMSQESTETFITEANSTDCDASVSPVSVDLNAAAAVIAAEDDNLNATGDAFHFERKNARTPSAGANRNLGFGHHDYHGQQQQLQRSSRKRTSSDLKKPVRAHANYSGGIQINMNANMSIASLSSPSPAANRFRPSLESIRSFDSNESTHSMGMNMVTHSNINTNAHMNIPIYSPGPKPQKTGSTCTKNLRGMFANDDSPSANTFSTSTWLSGRSPIDEKSFNQSMDLSMDDGDEDHNANANINARIGTGHGHGRKDKNAAKIRKLNLDPSTFYGRRPATAHPKQDKKTAAGDIEATATASATGNNISPNDVVVVPEFTLHTRKNHKFPSPPAIDFESDFVSPPAALSKRIHKNVDHDINVDIDADINMNMDTLSPSSSKQEENENGYTYSSFYGHRDNTQNRGSPSPRRMPKTPMLERKARRSLLGFIHEENGNRNSNNHHSQQHGKANTANPISRIHQDFEIISTIGDGSFGTVSKCKSRLDGCLYAIKKAKRRSKGKSDRNRMLQEVKALALLADVSDVAAFHIVRYHQAWIEDERLYIVTDLCTSTVGREMRDGLLKSDTTRQYRLLREMLLALKLIHGRGKVHLDIKPDNIFVKDDLYKLGDFGLVIDEATSGEVEEGDCRYMCKDLFVGNHRDLTKCDIFSLGITMYEIVTDSPLPADGQEWQDYRDGKLGPMSRTPLELQNIIRQMTHEDAEQRPTAAQLLTRRQLLSEERKKLILEQNKAREAQEAWEAKLKKITPPRRLLQRSNTCPR